MLPGHFYHHRRRCRCRRHHYHHQRECYNENTQIYMFHLCVYYRTMSKTGTVWQSSMEWGRPERSKSKWEKEWMESHTRIMHTYNNHAIAQFVIRSLCVLRIFMDAKVFHLNSNKCLLSDSINANGVQFFNGAFTIKWNTIMTTQCSCWFFFSD